MKHILSAFVALAAALTLGSCQVETLDPAAPGTDPSASGQGGFTLVATYGSGAPDTNSSAPGTNPAAPGADSSAPGTKAAFAEDGLGMFWTPGDVLYLIDPAGNNATVALTTDITEPAVTASFHTDEIVPTGDYIVVFGQDNLQVEKDLQIKASASDLNDQIRLYGYLGVTKGQTGASINMFQLYSMLSFNFANVPSGFSDGLSFGMAVAFDGLKHLDRGTISINGLQTEYSGTFVTSLGQIDGTTGCAFIAPVDFRNNRVVFFASGVDDDSNLHVYEIFKAGIDLQAGKRYTINIDFAGSSAKHVTLMQNADGLGLDLTSADDFFAAALAQWSDRLCLQNDVSFSNEIFLPLQTRFLEGNGYKLTSIQCSLEHCNNVGVVSNGGAEGLTVEGVSFTGAENVGAIAGSGYCQYCKGIDVGIIGEKQVGGLVGAGTGIIMNSSLQGYCNINGTDCVGGIAGSASRVVRNCVAKGESIIVNSPDSSSDYLGGIIGKGEGGAIECGFEGILHGGYYVGGVSGIGPCTKCYSVSDIQGNKFIGGVSGSGCCYDCYHIGDVNGAEYVAGISGSWGGGDQVYNCYSCGMVTSDFDNSSFGICMANDAMYLSTNLSSSGNLYATDSPEGLFYCQDFLAKLDVINAGGSYLDLCWPDNSYNCPILKWQYEGFSSDITIPSFVPVEW